MTEMKDHTDVCEHLRDIDQRDLVQLGETLGLCYTKLQRMQHIPEEMVAAWLREEDSVLNKSGKPTWTNLIQCLEKIGQNGIARRIKEKEKSDRRDLSGCVHCRVVGQSSFSLALVFVPLSVLLLLCLYCLWPTFVYYFTLSHSSMLPDQCENFHGRERDIETLTDLIKFDNPGYNIRVVNIIGSPGFGKSCLAIELGHEMVRRSVRVHYLNLVDFPNTSSFQQLMSEKVLESVGSYPNSSDFERLIKWAHNCYWSRYLLILDNCDDVIYYQKDEFQATLNRLAMAAGNVKVLFTSRKEIVIGQFSKTHTIHNLSTEAAIKVLEYGEQYGARLTTDQKTQIANYTGNVPLALQIFRSLLDRAGAPSPSDLIEELANNSIKTLSCPDFLPSYNLESIFDLSYRYLPEKLQNVSRQLTLFPGSFEAQAAVYVLRNAHVNEVKSSSDWEIDRLVRELVRSSLLQYDQHIKRFQYHPLIKEYFVQIALPDDTNGLLPAFNVFYADLLNVVYERLKPRLREPITLIALHIDQHNFHKLVQSLKVMKLPAATDEFFKIMAAILNVDRSIYLKFHIAPQDDLYIALENALQQFDSINGTITPTSHIYHQPSKDFFYQYIRLLAILSEKERRVWVDRKSIMEKWKVYINDADYIQFYGQLASYYHRSEDEMEAEKCKKQIFLRANQHLDTCTEQSKCTYVNVGLAYYKTGDHQKAAECLEKALEEEGDALRKANLLFYLIDSYSNYLYDDGKEAKAVETLCALNRSIINTDFFELLVNFGIVSQTLDIYEKHECHDEAKIFYETYIQLFKEFFSRSSAAELFSGERCSIAGHAIHTYKALQQLYDREKYEDVIEIAPLVMNVNKETNSDKINVKLKLLVAKARLYYTYNFIEALSEIESIFETIVEANDSQFMTNFPIPEKEQENDALTISIDLEEDIKESCLYLIPRFVYIDRCYNIKSSVLYGMVQVVFLPVLYEIGSFGSFFIDLLVYESHLIYSKPIKPAKITQELLPMIKPSILPMIQPSILPIQIIELSQAREDFVNSVMSIITWSLKTLYHILRVTYHVTKVILKLACIPLDVLLVWLRLHLICTTYFYIRRRILKAFVVEILNYCYVYPLCMLILVAESAMKWKRSFVVGRFVFHYIRDPRFECGNIMPQQTVDHIVDKINFPCVCLIFFVCLCCKVTEATRFYSNVLHILQSVGQ